MAAFNPSSALFPKVAAIPVPSESGERIFGYSGFTSQLKVPTVSGGNTRAKSSKPAAIKGSTGPKDALKSIPAGKGPKLVVVVGKAKIPSGGKSVKARALGHVIYAKAVKMAAPKAVHAAKTKVPKASPLLSVGSPKV